MWTEETALASVPAPLKAGLHHSPAPIRLVEAELLAPDHGSPGAERALVELTQVRRALAAVATVPEMVEIISRTRALQYYLQQCHESEELIREAMEINLRALRRAGEMLLAMEKNKGAATHSHDESAPPTLAQMGLDHNQSSRLQRLARIPPAHFEAYLAATKAAHEKFSVNGLVRHHQAMKRQEKQAAESEPQPGATIDAHPTAEAQEATVPPDPAASSTDTRPAIAEEIVTRVMAYVQEALAEVPASVLQAGFEQAVEDIRQRIATLPGLAHHERKDTSCSTC